MITVPLQIRYSETPAREAAAWFVAGDSPQRWLEELLAWQVSLSALSLYVVPRSAADLRPRGVVVIAPEGCKPSASGRCHGYARYGGRLYIPVESRLEPDLSDADLASLLPASGQIFVYHPAAGLVGFEAGDARTVADLLRLPPPQAAAWDRAEPGVAFSRRLTAIEPEATPSADDVFAAGQGDIGSRADQADELPPSPDEPANRVADKIKRGVSRKLAQAMQKLAGGRDPDDRQAGGAANRGAGRSRRSPGRLARWAQRQLDRLDEALAKLRHQALLRLLHQLEHDPDKGLQYALPFGESGHRGLGAPSAELPRHPVDFDLGQLNRGGPADRWDVSGEIYRRLREQYFQLANRELRLGRYRRAAYIFGMLLGMFDQAASALVAGRHWREAAVLYRTRLNRPDEAARCLEQGGLWSEATALYGELGQFEKAGDLFARLEQPDEAARCYRQAVMRHLLADDFLSAARLLESKLAAPDEALLQLDEGWPNSPQAAKCLEESFQLLARLGRHQQVFERIDRLRQSSLPGVQTIVVADVLAGLATSYPSQAVRPTAADAVRTIAAGRLRDAPSDEQKRLLDAVRRLAPEDRLLDRDCQRYVRGGPRLASQSPRPLSPSPVEWFPCAARRSYPRSPVALEKQFSLFPAIETEWHCAVSVGNRFYAAGYRPFLNASMVVAAEGLWDGAHRWLVHPSAWGVHDPQVRIRLASAPQGDSDVLLHAYGRRFDYLDLPAAYPFACPAHVGTPLWLPPLTLAVARSSDRITWALAFGRHDLTLDTFSVLGQLLTSRLIDNPFEPPSSLSPESINLCVQHATAFVAVRQRLLVAKPQDALSIDLDDEILHVAASPPLAPRSVALALRHVVAVFRTDGDPDCTLYAGGFDSPVVGFTLSGWLVAADAAECRVWRLQEDDAELVATLPCDGQQPLALLSTTHLHEFVLLLANGVVRVYRIAS